VFEIDFGDVCHGTNFVLVPDPTRSWQQANKKPSGAGLGRVNVCDRT